MNGPIAAEALTIQNAQHNSTHAGATLEMQHKMQQPIIVKPGAVRPRAHYSFLLAI